MDATEMKTKTAQQPPDWLKLEPGEEYVTSYQAQQFLRAVLLWSLAATVLGSVVTLIAVILGHKEGVHGLLTVMGTVSGIVISLGQISKQRLHVTSKMLVFGLPPKGVKGLPLTQVSRLERGTGAARWTISIYGQQGTRPVTKLSVFNTDEVLAALSELCQRAQGHESQEQSWRS